MDSDRKTKLIKGNLVMKILKEKCPHCGKGNVFKQKKRFLNYLLCMKDVLIVIIILIENLVIFWALCILVTD